MILLEQHVSPSPAREPLQSNKRSTPPRGRRPWVCSACAVPRGHLMFPRATTCRPQDSPATSHTCPRGAGTDRGDCCRHPGKLPPPTSSPRTRPGSTGMWRLFPPLIWVGLRGRGRAVLATPRPRRPPGSRNPAAMPRGSPSSPQAPRSFLLGQHQPASQAGSPLPRALSGHPAGPSLLNPG